MKKHLGGFICTLLILSITTISWKSANINHTTGDLKRGFTARELLDKYITNVYESAHLQESGLASNVFEKAITGFVNLKASNKLPQNSSMLTVIDFSKSSCEKRMWIIDVVSKALVLNTWVAHGQGSGEDMATRFSDKMNSHKSSLGFYLTNEVYYGDNGRSLKLDGLDAGFNTNARARAIVIHAADYVGENSIEQQGRLGRSFGCPAVAPEVADQVIDAIKDKTVLFINGNNNCYYSKYLDEELAANFLTQDVNSNIFASL
jgi:hypothetical protein